MEIKHGTIRASYESYLNPDDDYESSMLESIFEMMRRAEVNVDQEMRLMHDTEIEEIGNQLDFERIIAGIDWVFATYEYNESVFHFGKKMIELVHDTEKGQWGFSAVLANGKEYYASSEFNGIRTAPYNHLEGGK